MKVLNSLSAVYSSIKGWYDKTSLALLQRCVDDAQLTLDGLSAKLLARSWAVLEEIAEHEGKKAMLLLRGGSQLSETFHAFVPVISAYSKIDPNKGSGFLFFGKLLQLRGHSEVHRAVERATGYASGQFSDELCSMIGSHGQVGEGQKDAAGFAQAHDDLGGLCAGQGQLDQHFNIPATHL